MHRHRRDPLFTSKYHVDSHQRVVNHVSEMIGGQSRSLIAALQQHNVVHIVLMLDSPANQINKLDATRWTIGRTKPNRIRFSGLEPTQDFSLRKFATTRP